MTTINTPTNIDRHKSEKCMQKEASTSSGTCINTSWQATSLSLSLAIQKEGTCRAHTPLTNERKSKWKCQGSTPLPSVSPSRLLFYIWKGCLRDRLDLTWQTEPAQSTALFSHHDRAWPKASRKRSAFSIESFSLCSARFFLFLLFSFLFYHISLAHSLVLKERKKEGIKLIHPPIH